MKKIKNYIKGVFEVYCREFKLILHDQGLILFLTFLPLAYPVIYSLIYNPELVKDVPMVVIDSDRTSLTRELVRELDACDQVRVIGYAADLPEARKAMDNHDCFSILEIPTGFTKAVGRGETGAAALYCDMSLLLRYRGFLVASTNVMQEMGGELLSKDINNIAPLVSTISTGDLMPINNVSLGNIRNGFDSFIMPGVLILILQQCIILALGMAGGARHERAAVVGYNPHNNSNSVIGTMIGKALCYFTILGLPIIFLVHYVPLIFSFPMAGNVLEELAFLTPMVLASMGVGFVFQAFVTERESVFVSWVVTSIFFLLVSGLIWPRYDMPSVWKFLSGLCPATWGVEGFVKMNSNGAGLWQVQEEYEMLWILAAGWWVAAWCIQRWVVLPAAGQRSSRKSKINDKALSQSVIDK
ncbi:MAG: ABC transporter permease [Bacteroides sp.]|nr:ABC transporter permease [Bacteroides sp.]